MKELLTGNQSVARGFYEAGGRVATAYPGSPTVEIIETVKEYDEIYSEFSVNEKVALEVAIGGALYGARSMVVMKHVGVNIAMDPLMTFTQMPINGGFLLVSGDDPGMASSQNEQDNRIIGKFANMGILYPGNSQEAKDFTKIGLKLSEEFNTPMLLDITSRICHSRSIVELEDRVEKIPSGFEKSQESFTMLPPNTFPAQYRMKDRIHALSEYAYDTPINILEEIEGSDTVIITSGLMYENLKELELPVSIYKLGLVYPLSEKRISELNEKYKRIVVLEEMMPFIENEIKLMGIDCVGKEYFSFTGELFTEIIEEGLLKLGIVNDKKYALEEKTDIIARPPMFCAGCPHRPIFDILNKARVTVVGDIGCYSMSTLEAFPVSNIMVSMGATVGITKGMSKAMRQVEDDKPLVSVIGDGTFYHSGMTGFLNLMHQVDKNDNMTFIILDNSITAMTGGQPNASSGKLNKNADMNVDMIKLLNQMGIENVQKVDQFNYDETKRIIREEIKREGISVIISTRPCALLYKVQETPYEVDPEICIACRTCVRTNCPAIKMKEYEGIGLKSSIDPDACVGCSVCAQVCPVSAISRMEG